MLINSNNKLMTLKQYQTTRIIITFILALIFSQSLFFQNYIIPLIAIITASLILLFIRSKVKEIIADERDYAVAGKAASWAIQIYSYFAVAVMFILYVKRDINPAYEAIAITLAYSTCFLMIIYALIFRFYNKINFSNKKIIYSIILLVVIAILMIAGLRLFSGEDDWLCQNGQWVKHGQPSFPAPTAECQK